MKCTRPRVFDPSEAERLVNRTNRAAHYRRRIGSSAAPAACARHEDARVYARQIEQWLLHYHSSLREQFGTSNCGLRHLDRAVATGGRERILSW